MAKTTSTKKVDTYSRVTDAVIKMLEAGVGDWSRPWTGGGGKLRLPRRVNGEPYRSINVPLLWAAADQGGFNSATWMTLRQANELGGRVRTGERGSQVVFAGRVERPVSAPSTVAEPSAVSDDDGSSDGERATRSVPYMRLYTVFNVDQIEDLPERFVEVPVAPRAVNPDERDPELEAFVQRTGVRLEHTGNRACYSPALDLVRMPQFAHFVTAARYYGTLFHELTHWTGAETRTGRGFSAARFGDTSYAQEELVAELGSAFVCAAVGLEPIVCEHHAEYLGSWLEVLKKDSRAIFKAAADAQKAADFLLASWDGHRPSDAAEAVNDECTEGGTAAAAGYLHQATEALLPA